ncbi:CHAT domain-containing protein [Nostocoides sp. F2B08]|uniref:CHAT domain-containing protein n=1 Tax=Nostocoides sp. F2B08 TaxID=2653936 RepID=UPI001263836F|nr:CHAT domain-containing protein [Tetrasphaera sp. F2B08]KAB7743234.1 CHAT domain-containing protein [Tetrasphaera sp. F2B08]
MIDARSGNWAAAREELLEAVELFEHLGPVEQASTLITLGLADLSLRRLDDAKSHLERAREIAAAADLDAHVFKATHNLGCAYFVSGDLPRALTLMEEADAMDVEVSRDRAKLDHAEALMDAGLVEEAEELLCAALDDARESDHLLDVGDILLDLARCAVLRQDPDHARSRASEAVEAFATRQAESRQALAELFLAGLDLTEGRSADRALAAAARWRTPDPRSAEEVEATLVGVEAEVLRGHPDRARRQLARLRRPATLRMPVRIHEHYLRALVAHETGDDAGFAAAARAGSESLTTAQSAVQSLELRAALAQHAVRLAQLDLRRSIGSGSAAAFIDTIERWRAASARARELTISTDPRTTALIEELRWLSSPVGLQETEPAERDRRTARLQREIARRAWRTGLARGATPATDTLSHDTLAERLPAGTAYLVFAETAGEVYAAVTDGADVQVLRRIGSRDDVATLAGNARRDLRGSAFAQHQPALQAMLRRARAESAARLGEVLLGALPEVADHDRLVIAPNQTLHAVAWNSLPQVGQRPVTVTPSATRWDRHRAETPVAVERLGAHLGPGLSGARDEVSRIACLWGERGVGAAAPPEGSSTGDVAHSLASDDVVHVAAHGHHSGDDPLFSSLRLCDGPLFAHELVHDVRAQHVVLSACDVGRAQVRVGGEALGMTAALLAFGVRCVVAAVAPIADEASAAASVAYHERLARGQDAAAALAAAVSETPGAEPLVAFGSDVTFQT